MPDYRVAFPDGEAWKIAVKNKRGKAALEAAFTAAAKSRALDGKPVPPFEDCEIQKYTPQLRAQLKGLKYLTGGELLALCIKIAKQYQRRALGLTVRGMYYQLVSRGLLPSGQKEYNRVKNKLSSARKKGEFPLGLLTDASRTLHIGDATRYDMDVGQALNQARDWIPRLDEFFIQVSRWYRQPDLPLVLFEKEALSNVFGPICRELGVSWLATKGYPSFSTAYELHQLMLRSVDREIRWYGSLEHLGFDGLQALDPTNTKASEKLNGYSPAELVQAGVEEAQSELEDNLDMDGYWTDTFPEEDGSFIAHEEGSLTRYRYGGLTASEYHQGTGRKIRILYFGDHDPDGMEIPLDLERRLRIVQVRESQVIPFTVERLGLNRDQIQQYNPPPFWAKPSSTRHPKYLEEHPWAGDQAWELDALDPAVLQQLVRDGVNGYFCDDIHDMNQEAVAIARDRFNEKMRAELLPGLIR